MNPADSSRDPAPEQQGASGGFVPRPGRALDPHAAPAPDPLRGLRGVFAATLALEAVVVLLSLLVLGKVGAGATPLGVSVITGLAAAMVVAAGLQRRAWGLGTALALQVAMIACGLLVPVLGVLGVVFGLVWAGLLMFRREVGRRLAAGELPGSPDR